MPRIPFAKDLREKYPEATIGHKKKCTCFICGLKRDEMWAKDNPYEAKIVLEERNKKRQEIIELGNAIKSDPKIAKANRDYAIIGNKYYKTQTEFGKDSIHCAECLQRLGGESFPCPFGHGYSMFVYGKMINNPSDPRWNRPEYNRSKFQTKYRDSIGNQVTETTVAEQGLKERMKDGGNPEELK